MIKGHRLVMNIKRLGVLIFLGFVTVFSLYTTVMAEDSNVSFTLKSTDLETLNTGPGVKSVLMSSDTSKVYSINLEGLSIYEFDRKARKIERKLIFMPHPGKGYNYEKKIKIDSYQEKPVEAHITHDGRFLWVSLHNGFGVVVWDLQGGDTYIEGRPYKDAYLYERDYSNINSTKDTFTKKAIKVLWIKTGTTPKVITSSNDGKFLFVSNWHSGDVSVIKIDSAYPEDWMKIKDIESKSLPRGMIVSPDSKYLYVAQMGGDYIKKISLDNFETLERFKVGVNPRHLIINQGFLYTSLNISAKLLKIDIASGEIVKSAKTNSTPRTIALSKDAKIIFVVCYNGDSLQAFDADNLTLLGTWTSKSHPVALDVCQDGDTFEVWVGNHSSGTLNLFTIKKE